MLGDKPANDIMSLNACSLLQLLLSHTSSVAIAQSSESNLINFVSASLAPASSKSTTSHPATSHTVADASAAMVSASRDLSCLLCYLLAQMLKLILCCLHSLTK